MNALKLVVIGDPDAPHLRVLAQLPDEVRTVISKDATRLRDELAGADILLHGGFHNKLFREVFPAAKKLRWIHNLATGVEGIITTELLDSPAPLTNARGVFKASLAEFVLGAIFYFAKDFRRMVRNQMAGRWEQFDTTVVAGQTMGVVGYGEIGRHCGLLARAVGINVLALRRNPAPGEYAPDRIRDMLALCDYVVVAAPLTPATRGMIGASEIEAMKPEAVIVNIGRGPVIVEAALIGALESHRIKGAALDVFDREPLPEGHPFYRLENVLLSPHSADHVPGWIHLAMNKFMDNFWHFWRGEPLENIVDKRAGY